MADHPIRLCLVLHNHQPVGNFDDVIEQAYQDSYLPFLDLFESYSSLKIGLHTSGPLLLWLQQRHPDYLNRIRTLVGEGRIEIIGGAFYEPILTMIPSHDRCGQIRRFSEWLNQRFDTRVRGMWIPERVWEAGLVSDIVRSGIEYTVLDDYHFRCAGLGHDGLHGAYVSEDQGHTLRVYPGSEQLRYTIPFREPHETIGYLREIAANRDDATVVFADDGEKFGTWPETKQHVYENGWLRSFFDALAENRHWLHCTTLSEAADHSPARGKIYLPAASYREMTEWALPVERQQEFESIARELQTDWRWPRIRRFIHGGFWRNFKCKYSETNEMYARMMYVSRRLQAAGDDADQGLLDQARDHLYRGQCNCAYWHGAFGGVYLPHLRNAVYHHLIIADNLIEQALPDGRQCRIEAGDFDFDLASEVLLCNPHLSAWLAPSRGGHLYELDVRSIGFNLLATMQRRPEVYHDKVRQGADTQHDAAASIHDQVRFKQEGLDRMLIYDATPCKSLVDHFWQADAQHQEFANGKLAPLGDFADGPYESTLRRNPQRNQLLMARTGLVDGAVIKITKGVTLASDLATLEIAYLLENLPRGKSWRFGIEFNFAGMPANEDDRYYSGPDGHSLGHLGQSLDLADCRSISLSDLWLGLEAALTWDQPGRLWTCPVGTVSGSEGGFELVHQSVRVVPNWIISGDENGRWVVKLSLALQTTRPAPQVDESSVEIISNG
jgi:alpha-amylase